MTIVKVTNPDGTGTYKTRELHSVSIQDPPGDQIQADCYVDDLTALQIGLAAILHQLTFRSVDRQALLQEKRVEAGTFQIARVFFDWPDPEDNYTPGTPTALIKQEDDAKYHPTGDVSGIQYIEDSLDCYGENTVLRCMGRVETQLALMILVPNKDDRAAIRKVLVPALMGEPLDERGGRRVVIPQYYDQLARYDLRSVEYVGDDAEKAKSHMHQIRAVVDADISVVSLVRAPAMFKPGYGVVVRGPSTT